MFNFHELFIGIISHFDYSVNQIAIDGNLSQLLAGAREKKKRHAEACRFHWQGHKDLNPEPTVLETAALPIELYPYIHLFPKLKA